MTRVFIYSPLRILSGGHGYSYIFSPGTYRNGVLICELCTKNETKRKAILCGIPGQGGFRWKDPEQFNRINWNWISKSQDVSRFPFEWSEHGLEDYGTFFENVYFCGSKTSTSYIHCTWNIDNGNIEHNNFVEVTWRWLADTNNPIKAVVCVDGKNYAVGARCLNNKLIEWRTYWEARERKTQVEWIFELPPGTNIKIQKMMLSYHNKIFPTSLDIEHELPALSNNFSSSYTTKTLYLKRGFQRNVEISFHSFYNNIYMQLFSNIWDQYALEDSLENILNENFHLGGVIDEDMQYTFIPIEEESESIRNSPKEEESKMEEECDISELYIMNNWEEHVGIQEKKPIMSIIILFRGIQTSLLRRCLWSLEQQTLSKEDFEVYIALDGNKTLSFSSLVDQIPQNLQVHLFSFLKWQGICRLNQFLLSRVNGQYVGWLDHDDTLEPNCLAEVVDEYRRNQEKNVFVYTNFSVYDSKGNFIKNGFSRQPHKSLLMEQCGNHFRSIPIRQSKNLPLFHKDLCFGSEDQDMLFLMEKICTPKCIKKPLYNYYQNVALNNLSKNRAISIWLLQWSLLRNVYLRKKINNYCTFIETKPCPSNESISVFEIVYNRTSLKLYITNGIDYVPLRLSSTAIPQWMPFFSNMTIKNVNVQWESSQLSWIPLNTEKHWSMPQQLELSSFSQGIFAGAYWDLVIIWTDTLLDGAMIEFGNHVRRTWGCRVEIWGPWDWSEQLNISRTISKCLFWYFRSKEQEERIIENHVQWGNWLRSCPIDWKIQLYYAEWKGRLEPETDEWALAEYNNITNIDIHLLGIDEHVWEWLRMWVMKDTDGKVRFTELQNAILNRLCLRYKERHRGEVLFRFKSSLRQEMVENDSSTLVTDKQLLDDNS